MRSQEPEDRSQNAEVIALLPSSGFQVKLEDEAIVIAHAAGAAEKNFLRLRPGDRVRVVLSERDCSRGRIVSLL